MAAIYIDGEESWPDYIAPEVRKAFDIKENDRLEIHVVDGHIELHMPPTCYFCNKIDYHLSEFGEEAIRDECTAELLALGPKALCGKKQAVAIIGEVEPGGQALATASLSSGS